MEVTVNHLDIGKRVFLVGRGSIEEATVIRTPHKRKCCTFVGVSYLYGDTIIERDISLGDYGVSGYTYDNRPCKIFTNKESAEKEYQNIQEYYDAWFDLMKYEDY